MADAKGQAQAFVTKVFPTERMDELLDAIVKNVLSSHANQDFDSVGHHAIVVMMSYNRMTAEGTEVKYDVMTIPSEGLITDMYDFAGYVGNVAARMAPGRMLLAAWLIGEGWMVETDIAMPTKVIPSEHPERTEIILATGVALDERHNHAIFQFSRDDDNRIVVVEDDVEKIYVEAESQAYSRNTTKMMQEYYRVAVPILNRASKK